MEPDEIKEDEKETEQSGADKTRDCKDSCPDFVLGQSLPDALSRQSSGNTAAVVVVVITVESKRVIL